VRGRREGIGVRGGYSSRRNGGLGAMNFRAFSCKCACVRVCVCLHVLGAGHCQGGDLVELRHHVAKLVEDGPPAELLLLVRPRLCVESVGAQNMIQPPLPSLDDASVAATLPPDEGSAESVDLLLLGREGGREGGRGWR
jgi:hypothetical protein